MDESAYEQAPACKLIDPCYTSLDAPNVRGREGAEYRAGCRTLTPFQTTFKGTASYTVPKVDVLVSTVFQSLPGVELSANVTYPKSQIVWNAESASRATASCSNPTDGVGCLGATRNTTTVTVPLLLNNELFGERVTLFDVKLAKNIRFAGRRLSLGVDIYNVFNSDAVTTYQSTFTPDNPATTDNENLWLQPTGLVSPRFVRMQVQFNF